LRKTGTHFFAGRSIEFLQFNVMKVKDFYVLERNCGGDPDSATSLLALMNFLT